MSDEITSAIRRFAARDSEARFNAGKVMSVPYSSARPQSGQVYAFNAASGKMEPLTPSGSSFDPASPGNIGTSTPGSGAFTSLSSSSTTALNGTTIPASKTLVVTTDKISALAATTSAELAGVISDETGSGALVFATSPTLVTPALVTPALGTPASGNLANCTFPTLNQNTSGTAANVTGTVAVANGGTGATTASAARVNLLPSYTGNGSKLLALNSGATDTEWVASSAVNLASPGPIGNTTPSTGAFTTLSASGASSFPNSAPSVIGGLGFRNRIINGDMRIDQRNEGGTVTTNGSFPVDRWTMPYNVTSLLLTAQRSTTAATGFLNSLLVTATTGASAGAAETVLVRQNIEGQNVPDFMFGTANAKTVTVSFWVRSSLAGIYCCTIKNSAQDRAYVAEYTINAANTFEYKTVTVSGDTSGTWLTTNGIGVRVEFDLGSGTNFNATVNTWTGSNVRRTTNQVNWCGTTGRTFYVTGVQLEIGNAASEFERRDFGLELVMCQRYFEKSMSVGTAITSGRGVALALPGVTSIANGDYYANFYYKVKKRTATPIRTTIPFTTAANTGRLSNNVGTDYGADSAVATGGDSFMLIQNNSGGALTVASGLILGGWTSSDEL